MRKRFVAILMAAVMGISLIGCGQSGSEITENTGADSRTEESGSTYSEPDEKAGEALGEWLAELMGGASGATQEAKANQDGGTNKGTDLSRKSLTSEALLDAEAVPAGMYYTKEMDPADGWYEATEQPEIDWNTEEYNYFAENPWMAVKSSPFSTFAADVDTASYANLRRMLTRGQTVPASAVRLEEMINYFHYDYPQPAYGEPFSVTTEMAPCPWNEDSLLFMVGLAAKELDDRERADSNLVFLIDVSGSMEGADRLGLVQRSFKLLCEELRPGDRVSVVTYATGDKIVLDGATGEDRTKICEAIEDLFASGGTNGSAGIQTAYEMAEKYFIEGGNNRVILATDGDLNIGVTDQGSLVKLIEDKAKSGVFLSVLGFGWGNLSDARMEALADHGNGNYHYIDNIAEARKVLIEEMGSNLFTVAKDVKLQVEFNPAQVKGYRLIGYENRTMAAEDFANDEKDGGEIGAGHQVTALYEVALKNSEQEIPEVESRYGSGEEGGAGSASTAEPVSTYADEYMVVNIRYKEPDGDTSKLLTYPVYQDTVRNTMSENLSWAAGVAQAGMLLKKSEFAGTSDMKQVMKRLGNLESVRNDDYRKEFVYLFSKYVAE